MVRLALLIVSLLGMFLLNACSGNSRDTTNLDTKDAVYLQTGKFSGKLERVAVAEYDEEKQTVVKKPQTPIFNAEDSTIEVDWDNKKVTMVTALVDGLSQSKKSEPIILEGQFNDEGIAYLFPTNTKGKDIKAIGGIRCKDNKCEKLTIDIGADIKKDGQVSFEQEQMDITNPTPLKVEIPEAIKPAAGSGTEEILEPESSGARNTGPVTKAELEAKKKEETKKLEAKKKAEQEAEEKAAAEAEDGDEEEMYEPGVVSNLPSVLRPEMRDQQGGIKLTDYSESKLFPYNLGEKYSGKALGAYDRGRLTKGTDIAISGTKNVETRMGFSSVDRADKRYYASGLMVRILEEAGKIYSKYFPNTNFEIDDLSKKDGGLITKRVKTRRGKWVNVKVHASHQNGLDGDIWLPKAARGFDYKKTWSLLKSFVSLGYVDIIILNPARIRELCTYVKTTNEKVEDYSKIFNNYIYQDLVRKRVKGKWIWVASKGHTTHMHLRLQCTNHNIGCAKMTYTKAKYATCK